MASTSMNCEAPVAQRAWRVASGRSDRHCHAIRIASNATPNPNANASRRDHVRMPLPLRREAALGSTGRSGDDLLTKLVRADPMLFDQAVQGAAIFPREPRREAEIAARGAQELAQV